MNQQDPNLPGASTLPQAKAASGCACSPDGGGCGSSGVDGQVVEPVDRSSRVESAATLGTLTVRVQRYRPDRDQVPYLQDFDVPWSQDTSVLDALNWIKENLDPTLAFRWSCRMAICGSCGFMLNGVPKLGCEQFVRDYAPGPLRIEPLENLAVERDLVVDLEPFMASLAAVKPYVITDLPNLLSGPGNLQTPEQMLAYSDYSMCINCMLCYSACPQVALATDFLGPAAITAAVRYNHDSRDHGEQQRLPVLDTENGLWSCTFVGECSAVCPKGVDPAAAIQQAKASAALSWVAEFALPYQGNDR